MYKKLLSAGAGALALALYSTSALATEQDDIAKLRKEVAAMRQNYETKINSLESKISQLEKSQAETKVQSQAQAAEQTTSPNVSANPAPISTSQGRSVYDNSFNPSIGIILNGKYSAFSNKKSGPVGFAEGEEAGRPDEGFAVDESELNFSANVDDKFTGSLTASLVQEDGDTGVELEEAYIQNLPGLGLPQGTNLKFGRALWDIGYLNSHHAHTDDFADRPLPYRIFFNNAFNDDGVQASYVLPTGTFVEVGGGLFKGADFPGGDGGGSNSYTGFLHVGDDIGDRQNYRIGTSILHTRADSRLSNDDNLDFAGDNTIYGIDFRYNYAPTGNAQNQELTLQGEYFWRDEKGDYNDKVAATGAVPFNESSKGWYAQTVYKFLPEWRVGYRYTALEAPETPAALAGSLIDAGGYDPYINSVMLDWTNSEFSRVRLQYNKDDTVRSETDHQIMLQYIMSIGAHGAHTF